MSKKHRPAQVLTLGNGSSRVLLAGDLHGDVNRSAQIVMAAKRERCTRVVYLGDFGYWEHYGPSVKELDSINKVAAREGIMIDFIDGNHDNHPLLWERYCGEGAVRNEYGFAVVRSHVNYIERGHHWSYGSTPILALGGASSADQEWRRARERGETKDLYGRRERASGVGTLWWPTETITDADVETAVSTGKSAVLLSHDAPLGAWSPERKDYPAEYANRARVTEVLEAVEAQHVFHGHFHVRRNTLIDAPTGKVSVTGLSDNRAVELYHQIFVLES